MYIIEGENFVKLGQYSDAITSYDKALAINPNDNGVWYNRGVALNILGRHMEALASFDKAIAIDPEYSKAWSGRGVVQNHLGQYTEAVASFDRATAINPDNSEMWYNRGVALIDLGQFTEALTSFYKVLSIDPDHAATREKLGLAYMHLGMYTEAEATFKKIIKLDPDNVQAHSALADIYLLLQKLGDAEKYLRKAIKIQPDIGSLYADLGHVLSRSQKDDKALVVFLKALELEPDIPVRNYNVGDIYLALGNTEEAVPYLEKASQMAPQNPLYHYDLGKAFFDLGRYDECALASEAALRNDPNMKFARTNIGLSATVNLGLAYMNLEKYAEAEACFQRNLHLVGSTYFNLGLTLHRQKKYEGALTNFKRAVELVPDDPEYWDLVGNAYLELNRLEDAREALQRAIGIDDTYVPAHYDLGVVLSRMQGREEDALKAFNRAIDLDQNYPLPYYSLACIYALKTKKKLALDFLEKAIEKGFKDWAYIEADSDLDSIRNDKRFKKIMKLMQEEFANNKRNSLQMIGVKIKPESVPIVNRALKTGKGQGLAPIKYFLSRAVIDCDGELIFKASEDGSEDPYCPFEDGTTIALFGTWEEHEQIASWLKLHAEKGKMVLFSYNGDGAAWGWEFDGKGRMRELQFRSPGKRDYPQKERFKVQIAAVEDIAKLLGGKIV